MKIIKNETIKYQLDPSTVNILTVLMTLPNIYGGAFLEKKLTAKSYYYFRKKALPYMLFSVLNVPLRNLCEKNNKQTKSLHNALFLRYSSQPN